MMRISLNPSTHSPEYKRIAAFLGDLYFLAPRRHTLSIMSTTQNVWSYSVSFSCVDRSGADILGTSLEKRQICSWTWLVPWKWSSGVLRFYWLNWLGRRRRRQYVYFFYLPHGSRCETTIFQSILLMLLIQMSLKEVIHREVFHPCCQASTGTNGHLSVQNSWRSMRTPMCSYSRMIRFERSRWHTWITSPTRWVCEEPYPVCVCIFPCRLVMDKLGLCRLWH